MTENKEALNTPEEELESPTDETTQEENLDENQELVEDTTEKTNEEETSETNPEITEEPLEERKPSRRKLSRRDRRIRQLAQKNRELLEKLNAQREIPTVPPLQGDEVDVPQLEEYINQRANQVVEFKLQQQRNEDQYKKTAMDWADDLDKTIQENPELDPKSPEYNPLLENTLSELVEKANFDENGNPRPRIKVSNIYANLKKVMEGKKNEGGKVATQKLMKQIGEGAVNPSSQSKEVDAEQDEFNEYYKQDLPPGFSV